MAESVKRATDTDASAIPVTVLTGFLGSGKTTLLNRVLSCEHGLKIGVIVNEFGAVSIDDKVITRQEDGLIELANGCVCCTMAGDLIKSMARLVADGAGVDYILVETTGLADPAPVAAALCHGELGRALRLDSIVTVVDAYNFDANLERAEAAYNQLASADILLVNKIDLVEPEVPDLIEKGVRKINAAGRFLRAAHAAIDPRLILGVDLFRLKGELDRRAAKHAHDGSGEHGHLADFDSIALGETRPLDSARFAAFMDAIPESVFRAKGIVNVAGSERRHIFHLVGDRRTVTEGETWRTDEPRRTDLVLIGHSIDGDTLASGLAACGKAAA